jgi:hypothetical protein
VIFLAFALLFVLLGMTLAFTLYGVISLLAALPCVAAGTLLLSRSTGQTHVPA